MANSFSKEEIVAFEQEFPAFEDKLAISKHVSKYSTNMTQMERSRDIIWRPQPYIAQSFDGTDATAHFGDATQLAVPATLGFSKHSAWKLSAKERRDALQEQRLYTAAFQKLASDINVAIAKTAALQGSMIVARSTAAAGFDDVAQCEAIFNEQGINDSDRFLALSTRDYNGMASNLAARATMTGKPTQAYEAGYVGRVSSFETYKLDYITRLAAATATTVKVNGANQFYTPKAISVASSGEVSNVDNRYQSLIVSVGGSTLKVGDCFTIAGVNAVHHITKQDTGQLKTFRVTALVSGAGASGTIQISPPIISGDGGTDAEKQYQNVTATPADQAVITLLNTQAGYHNPFWYRDAIEILPGRYEVPDDAGVAVHRGTTENGIEVVVQKFYDINTMVTKYRADILFGTVMKQPEMCGALLFSMT